MIFSSQKCWTYFFCHKKSLEGDNETNSSHLKMYGWKMSFLLGQKAYFQGRLLLAVSFRVPGTSKLRLPGELGVFFSQVEISRFVALNHWRFGSFFVEAINESS